MSDVTLPTLDRSVLDELRRSTGDDNDFLGELIEAYLVDGAGQLDAIEAGVKAGDAMAVVRPAHTLKSSSASLGATRLAEICRELEEEARLGRVEGLDRAVAAARSEWTATVEALRSMGDTRTQ